MLDVFEIVVKKPVICLLLLDRWVILALHVLYAI